MMYAITLEATRFQCHRQQRDRSIKFENTTGNDYVISSNAQHLRLSSNGFITSGSAQAGTSFAQSDNIAIAPTPGGNIQLAAQTAVGGQFTPATNLHVRSTGNFQEAILEA